ncbi:DNA-directed DNA polymerase II large subunit [Methanofollis tationis]|uniref:DNA polymerase II large subunit n=1 Tax=Methanofollis tationis TaxID=81417 RepID=A0A7K4HRR2_9EURY|nr:DNA-directed DNA polymerase II large subunit [Methanofollis tationis]NVO67929.1 DNA-directed DNA polymerase II large subunit [Methanofollis tationis]
MVAVSPAMAEYFRRLEENLNEAISVAEKARSRGYDPTTAVEIPRANDIGDRVEVLVGVKGVAERVRALEKEMSREEVSLKIGDDFVAKMFGETTREEIVDHAIRTSMGILTEGVVAAPTEGIAKVAFGKNDDGTEYLKVYYAGPIRSAGGTAQALSVLVGDYVRQALGIDRYKPRKEEVERYIEELKQYNGIQSMQYMPSEAEIRLIIENCPVCIDGEPTEREEVSGYRNLERVETNTVRGGMCLVVAEGLALKAPKVMKNVKKMKMEGWDWLQQIIDGVASKSSDEEEEPGVHPKDKYIRDLIGGRPVFSYPMRKGGFRLRYGRSRNTGFAAAGFHPATLHILGDYLAVGTQMKTERPGKAAGVVPVDTIEGPTVLLASGEVRRVDDTAEALAIGPSIVRILDVGEILISYGEFLENNHPLIPSSYCEEWWLQEGGPRHPENEMEAIEFALSGAPLHPDYIWFWDDLAPAQIRRLAAIVSERGRIAGDALRVVNDPELKAILEEVLVPHTVEGDEVVIRTYLVFLACLGLDFDLHLRRAWEDAPDGPSLALVSHLSGFTLRSKAGTRIGGRMGRPGKSKPREMKPAPHVLFPVGESGGARRSVQNAGAYKDRSNADGGTIHAGTGERRCPQCGAVTFKNRCEACGTHTTPVYRCPRCNREVQGPVCPACQGPTVCLLETDLRVKEEYAAACARLGMRENAVKLVKGVKGMISRDRTIEPLEKGVLRAAHEVYVFKDGTVRYDMIDLPVTHVRPREIGAPVERLVAIGYTHDYNGAPLTSPDQILELRCQDILVSEKCGDWLLKVSQFLDDLLEKFYGLPRFYNAEKPSDLIGQMLIGLAPHTSAGVLCRLLGFTKASVGYAHPFYHAAKRRNCFAGDTEIRVFEEKGWRSMPVRQFVLENFDLTEPGLDAAGTHWSPPKRYAAVQAVDSQGNTKLRRVTAVSIHRAPEHLIHFETARGKTLEVTPEHTMLVWDLCYLKKIMAMEVREGDRVPVAEGGQVIADTVTAVRYILCPEEQVYCLTVAEDHTLAANGIFCGQCDGDEDCVMFLLDGLINFSRSFLPETRGGSMDAPLVLTTRLDPKEVDKESLNVDVMERYPLELYEAALRYAPPRELEKVIDHVELRVGKPEQYEGFRFTHDTSDISAGPLESTYTTLGSMFDKMEAELELGEKIRAVDVDDVAERVLNTHFIRDLMGNLRAFASQTVRCTKCATKYRRMPLAGKCPKCGGKVNQTVHEASVKKYLEMSRRMCEKYAISDYTKQRVEVLDMAIDSTFGKEREKQLGLADFM